MRPAGVVKNRRCLFNPRAFVPAGQIVQSALVRGSAFVLRASHCAMPPAGTLSSEPSMAPCGGGAFAGHNWTDNLRARTATQRGSWSQPLTPTIGTVHAMKPSSGPTHSAACAIRVTHCGRREVNSTPQESSLS
jgi:hypothetical protein